MRMTPLAPATAALLLAGAAWIGLPSTHGLVGAEALDADRAPPASIAPVGTDDPRFDGVRALIQEAIRDEGIASVAVSVSKGGEFIWEEGFGWADRERQLRATPHTPYSLASISKPITATAIMILAQRGELDLDAPANRYLSPTGQIRLVEARPEDVTVRRVLSHTAGLPLHYQFFYEGADYGAPASAVSIQRYGVVVHEPGRRLVYSNIGYGVLDRMVEVVSGRSFGDVLQTEVFTPLGMHRSSLDIRPGLEPFAAARYGNRQELLPFYSFDHPGASAVYASAHDLVRFGLFHLGIPLEDQRRILDEDTRLAMQIRNTPTAGPFTYGLGWVLNDDHGGHRMVSHSGGMPGVSTQLQLFPDQEVVIAVVTNGVPPRSGRFAAAIAQVVLPDFQMPEPGAGAPGEEARFQPPAALVGRWEGSIETYEGSVELWLDVREDGDVHVKLEGQMETVVNNPRFEDGVFRGRFGGVIPAPDMIRHPHDIAIELTLERGTLRGSASAMSTTDPIHWALSSRLRLSRAGE
jgi:CubicO group peptidase (beta-lactamase class C family)